MAARIHVVDDDESMRELIRMHLEAAGYEVVLAEDAVVAGYSLLRSPPDLILCDVNMPHMTGFEFVAAIKADRTVPDVPVVFLTSEEDSDDHAKALGAVGYLIKPVRVERLLSTVAKHVAGGTFPIG